MKPAAAKSRGLEFFDQLRDFVRDALTERGISDDDIDGAIRSLEKSVADYWGGQQIYVPRAALELALRNEQIYRDYNGANVDYLCRKYKLCGVQIRQIISGFRGNKKAPPAPEEGPAAEDQRQLF